MFQQTLLDSSPATRKRRGWTLATAFTMQITIAGALVVVPLLSAAIIPLTSPVLPVPLTAPGRQAERPAKPTNGSAAGMYFKERQVISINTSSGISILNRDQHSDEPHSANPSLCPGCLPGTGTPTLFPSNSLPPVHHDEKPLILSHMDPGMLLNKVVPLYPPIAIRTGVQGDVKLHAIIAKDGTIQSLSVISGPPMLLQAAMEAVQQWRYRPYVLNGEKVEVETYVTVTFRRSN